MSKSNECPECGAIVPPQLRRCPACGHLLAQLKQLTRSSRGKRYVYGRRKQKLSQEAIGLIIVLLLGLIIVLASQLLAFLKARKLVERPAKPAQIQALNTARSQYCGALFDQALASPGDVPPLSSSQAAFTSHIKQPAFIKPPAGVGGGAAITGGREKHDQVYQLLVVRFRA